MIRSDWTGGERGRASSASEEPAKKKRWEEEPGPPTNGEVVFAGTRPTPGAGLMITELMRKQTIASAAGALPSQSAQSVLQQLERERLFAQFAAGRTSTTDSSMLLLAASLQAAGLLDSTFTRSSLVADPTITSLGARLLLQLQQRQDQISREVLELLRLAALDRLPHPMGITGLSSYVLPQSLGQPPLGSTGGALTAFGQQSLANQPGLFPTNQGLPAIASSIDHARRLHAAVATNVTLPSILAQPEDIGKLSSHQVFLRQQIEAFQATEDDVTTHTRGRNKPIVWKQVGIRCRHCAKLPVARRQKGSTYFPASLLGLYQAAQNMNCTHMQCGLCSEMPDSIKQQFALQIGARVASSGGRPYWAASGKKLGLVDTDKGIHFIRDMPPGVQITEGVL